MLAALARHAREAERIVPDGLRIAATTLSNTAAALATPSVRPSGPLMKEFQLYRFDPENDEKPYYKSYRVDVNSYVLKVDLQFVWLSCVSCSLPCHIQVWPHDA